VRLLCGSVITTTGHPTIVASQIATFDRKDDLEAPGEREIT
jgi:alkanesulfonate monooxygenase SsuD/methylene tetrahydromethanopterin reductase-like flavin-dependent oxidoreductase (luciferase family)